MTEAAEHDDLIAHIPVLAWLGLRHVESGDPAVYSVEIDLLERHRNLAGAIHGGVLATLIDHCGGHAAGVLAGQGGPTADLHVRYLARAKSGPIRADARVVRAGRRLVITETRVTDGEGTLIAIGDMSVAPRAGRSEPAPD